MYSIESKMAIEVGAHVLVALYRRDEVAASEFQRANAFKIGVTYDTFEHKWQKKMWFRDNLSLRYQI